MSVQIGIIGGSGLYDMAELTDREERAVETPFGSPSGAYILGTLRGKRVAFLPRHDVGHRLMPSELNFRANIYGFKLLGVEAIISASAVGSLREELEPLDLVFPDQFIDRTFNRTATFFGNGIVAHVAFAHPICDRLRHITAGAAQRVGATVHNGGTYVCMEGPQFSTFAESNLYRSWGADIIGMTNLQEAKLAREAEICYTTMALVTDYDCWHPDHDSVTVELIIANLTQNAKTAQQVIAEAVEAYRRPAHLRLRDRARHVDHHAPRGDPGPGQERPCAHHWEVPAMKLVITGSIAFDYLMSFPGKFTDHLLPEHMHRVSLSFLVDTMDKRRGGCAPNIAYTLALLGEKPIVMATAGQDIGDYRAWMEAAGIDTSLMNVVPGKFTASFFCSTDQAKNQIASFYTGAMANAGELSFRTVPGLANGDGLVIISPNDPGAMVQYAEECSTLDIRYIWDPGQQCARMDGPQLADGVKGAYMVIVNDYEFELLRQKTGMGEPEILNEVALLVVTRGEDGCSVITKDGRVDVPAVPPARIEDPTGVGDAFRGGFMKGLAIGASYEVCARLGSVAATYALEHLGGTSHAYTKDEFKARYEKHFGALNSV